MKQLPFDALVLHAVVSELRPELTGARINRIHQPDAHTLLLRYHGAGGHGKLLLSSHPQNGRLHKTEESRENPEKAPLFAMVLRKWLEGARITAINAVPGERVAAIYFDARDELGDITRLTLMIEIMGKHSNLILVSTDGLVIDGIRRYGSSLSRYREVLPGRPYREPPPQNKLPLPPENEAILAAALYAQAEMTLARALTAQVGGLSPLLAEHICLTAGLNPELAAGQLGEYELSRLWQALRELGALREADGFTPTLLKRNGHYADCAAILPAGWQDLHYEHAESMNQALELLSVTYEAEQNFRKKKQSVEKPLRQHIGRLAKKISLQEGELERSEAAESYKEAGDLLAANLWQLKRGQSEAILPAFDDPERLITISLDPACEPRENVQDCYRRYAKAKSARVLIERQLIANRAELDYIFSVEQALADSETDAELAAVIREAETARYYHPPAPPRAAKKQQESTSAVLPPRRFVTSDGFTVYIGRNNKQNDRLSLKQAQNGDIWLHTQKIPGAHVIIESNGKEVSDTALAEAAAWAAWFSKARDSDKAPVDYVPAGCLKKPPGAHPGFVTYSGQKTLYVRPEAPNSVAADI